MDGFIAVITVVLVVAYLAFAIYSIIESDTTGKRVGLTVAFAAGGCVSVTVEGKIYREKCSKQILQAYRN